MNPLNSEHTRSSAHFRTLSRKEKLDELLAFCIEHKRIPRTFKNCTDEQERYLGNFYFNNKSQLNKYASAFPEDELKIFRYIEKYVTKRIPRKQRLEQILEFCETHNKIPSQVSKDEVERKLGHLMNSFRLMHKKNEMDAEECVLLDKILTFKNGSTRSKKDRLLDVLQFCKTHNRTPKQHVGDQNEKRMGEFLTTVKMAFRNNKLDEECVGLINEIMQFSTPTRDQKLESLLSFVQTNKRSPKMNSDDSTERLMASFFIKLKIQLKNDKLTSSENEKLQVILNLCEIKSRKEKIEALIDYCKLIGRIPKLNSDDSEERKQAMFLNNMKQLKRKNKLKPDEIALMNNINSLSLVVA